MRRGKERREEKRRELRQQDTHHQRQELVSESNGKILSILGLSQGKVCVFHLERKINQTTDTERIPAHFREWGNSPWESVSMVTQSVNLNWSGAGLLPQTSSPCVPHCAHLFS